jgi:hypothetical protein
MGKYEEYFLQGVKDFAAAKQREAERKDELVSREKLAQLERDLKKYQLEQQNEQHAIEMEYKDRSLQAESNRQEKDIAAKSTLAEKEIEARKALAEFDAAQRALTQARQQAHEAKTQAERIAAEKAIQAAAQAFEEKKQKLSIAAKTNDLILEINAADRRQQGKLDADAKADERNFNLNNSAKIRLDAEKRFSGYAGKPELLAHAIVGNKMIPRDARTERDDVEFQHLSDLWNQSAYSLSQPFRIEKGMEKKFNPDDPNSFTQVPVEVKTPQTPVYLNTISELTNGEPAKFHDRIYRKPAAPAATQQQGGVNSTSATASKSNLVINPSKLEGEYKTMFKIASARLNSNPKDAQAIRMMQLVAEKYGEPSAQTK